MEIAKANHFQHAAHFAERVAPLFWLWGLHGLCCVAYLLNSLPRKPCIQSCSRIGLLLYQPLWSISNCNSLALCHCLTVMPSLCKQASNRLTKNQQTNVLVRTCCCAGVEPGRKQLHWLPASHPQPADSAQVSNMTVI